MYSCFFFNSNVLEVRYAFTIFSVFACISSKSKFVSINKKKKGYLDMHACTFDTPLGFSFPRLETIYLLFVWNQLTHNLYEHNLVSFNLDFNDVALIQFPLDSLNLSLCQFELHLLPSLAHLLVVPYIPLIQSMLLHYLGIGLQ